MTRVVLNPNQRRHLEVVFEGLERALHQLEALFLPKPPDALSTVHHDLPDGFAEAAGPAVLRMRAAIGRLAVDWGLRGSDISDRRTARALLVAQMIRLEESGRAGLRGFGAVDPSVPAVVEPQLEALIRDLRAVIHLLDAGTAGGMDPGAA